MILNTKLSTPRIRNRAVERRHLVDLMNDGLEKEARKLTLVVGPAGFGKLMLVSMWLAQLDRPHRWVALDQTDVDERQFFMYLLEPTRRLHPDRDAFERSRWVSASRDL